MWEITPPEVILSEENGVGDESGDSIPLILQDQEGFWNNVTQICSLAVGGNGKYPDFSF